MQNNKFYKIKDIAEMSGLSSHIIRKSIFEKKLNAIRLGKIYFIHADDFNHFIHNLRTVSDTNSKKKAKYDYSKLFPTKKTELQDIANVKDLWKKYI